MITERSPKQRPLNAKNERGVDANVLLLNRTKGEKDKEEMYDLIISRALCPEGVISW